MSGASAVRERATPDQPAILYAPTGDPIIGTYERVWGRAEIVRDSFRVAGEGADAYLEFDWEGGTEVFWDGQETESCAGQRVFLDDAGNEWLESELIAGLLGKPAPAMCAEDYHDFRLDKRELATVLAALRIYQQQMHLNGGAVPPDVVDIATDCSRLAPLTDTHVEPDQSDESEIDALCTRLNLAP